MILRPTHAILELIKRLDNGHGQKQQAHENKNGRAEHDETDITLERRCAGKERRFLNNGIRYPMCQRVILRADIIARAVGGKREFPLSAAVVLQRKPQPAVVDGAVAVQDSPAAVGKKGRLIVEDLLLGQHQTAEHSGVKLKNDQSSGFPAVHQRAAKRHGFFASVHIGVHPHGCAAAAPGLVIE